MNWITCIPLVGGSAIGCYKSLGGVKPAYHLSYSDFSYNEKSLDEYWPDIQKFIIDSENFSLSELPEIDIDMVNSVCPCAGLSRLNHHASADSKRNDWMYESTEFILENIKPKVLWGENAPALATKAGEKVAKKLAEIGRSHGYSFSMMKTNAIEHGMPQNRSRTFYFLWKSQVAPIIGYHRRPRPTFVDWLAQVPADAPQNDIFLNPGNPLNDIELSYLLNITGKSYQELIKSVGLASVCTTILRKAGKDKNWLSGGRAFREYLDTLDSEDKQVQKLKRIYDHIISKMERNMGFMDHSLTLAYKRSNAWVASKPFTTVHPLQPRFFSIREHLHMMGMPHDFNLHNPLKSVNVVCQNVPTNTTEDLVKEVKRFIDEDPTLIFAPGNYVVQNNRTKRVETTKMIWDKYEKNTSH